MLLTGPWPEDACMFLMVSENIIMLLEHSLAITILALKVFFAFVVKNVWALQVGIWANLHAAAVSNIFYS